MSSVLLIGYGNASRRDDGVAFHIIARVCREFGLPCADLSEGDLQEEVPVASGAGVAVLCLHQLGPELAETVAGYDAVVFIDAHVEGAGWAPVAWQELQPAYRPYIVTHHLRPEAVLALCQTLHGAGPRGYLLSVLGSDFDFGEQLSPKTADRADDAVRVLGRFLVAEGAVGAQAEQGQE